jgi:hypothetical protein
MQQLIQLIIVKKFDLKSWSEGLKRLHLLGFVRVLL